jgi:hypothetical protein
MRCGRLIRQTAVLLVLYTTVALAGCSPTQSTESTSASDDIDLARLAALEHDFPPDFIAHAGQVQQLEAQYVDQVGTTVSYGKSFTVDPPQCRALLKPVDGQVGADYVGVRGDGPGPDEPTILVGANDQVTVPAEIPATGCDRMAFDVDSAIPDGTAERIPAPHIPGATTIAFKVQYDPAVPPEYYYIAILDSHVYVHVDARVAPSFQAQPFLPDLLVKAVTTIRGQ